MTYFLLKDYLSDSRDRITEQFKEKPIIDRLQEIIHSEATEIQNTLSDMLYQRWLENAKGKNLEVIGDIVGQPRTLFDSVIIYYFGFQGATGALSFGTRSNPNVGGVFKSRNDPLRGTRYLNDIEYKAIIKIKILKNTTIGVIDEFIAMTKLLYNVNSVTYTESGGVVHINIGRDYNDQNLSLFKGLDEIKLGNQYLPLPIGVRLEFDGNVL